MNDPAAKISELLSEMQRELSRRAWSEDIYDRIEQASDFRGKLSDAIRDYAEYCVGKVRL